KARVPKSISSPAATQPMTAISSGAGPGSPALAAAWRRRAASWNGPPPVERSAGYLGAFRL
ncbi:hypothetical protein ABZ566_32850, partial [Streptomyces hygroscopicus]|uniref:hypothetical protein n=1 Tax=Streptomyces hygroscopicus TaxID=1912 RepID=UPI0033C7A1CF